MDYCQRFFAALRSRDIGLVTDFLDQDPELVNMWEEGSVSPLHVAAGRGDKKIATLLLSRGANLESQCKGVGSTPLKYAVFYAQIEMVRFLLKRGANPSNKGGTSKSPLDLALCASSPKFRKMGTPGSDLDYARIGNLLGSKSIRK